jgi:putative salt-induced outer membrane protein YdiY
MLHRAVTAALVLAFACAFARADVVLLQNGDVVTGKIVTAAEGKLTLKSDEMGTLQIPLNKIKTFSTQEPIVLRFQDGTVVNQKIRAADDGRIATLEGGVLAPQEFPISALEAVNPPEKPKAVWKGHVTAGYTQTTGNAESTNASLDAEFVRRGEDDRITVNGNYLYGRQTDSDGNDNLTNDKWYVSGKYDYFFTKKTYLFVNASYEKDRVADLDARAIGGAGCGYQWLESKRMNFSTDLGLGAMHEEYTNPTVVNNTVVGQAGYHYDWTVIDERLTFLHDLRYVPDLEAFSNYTVRTSAELRTTLTKALFASFKVLVDYNSNPAAGKKTTDVMYIFGLGVNF